MPFCVSWDQRSKPLWKPKISNSFKPWIRHRHMLGIQSFIRHSWENWVILQHSRPHRQFSRRDSGKPWFCELFKKFIKSICVCTKEPSVLLKKNSAPEQIAWGLGTVTIFLHYIHPWSKSKIKLKFDLLLWVIKQT